MINVYLFQKVPAWVPRRGRWLEEEIGLYFNSQKMDNKWVAHKLFLGGSRRSSDYNIKGSNYTQYPSVYAYSFVCLQKSIETYVPKCFMGHFTIKPKIHWESFFFHIEKSTNNRDTHTQTKDDQLITGKRLRHTHTHILKETCFCHDTTSCSRVHFTHTHIYKKFSLSKRLRLEIREQRTENRKLKTPSQRISKTNKNIRNKYT